MLGDCTGDSHPALQSQGRVALDQQIYPEKPAKGMQRWMDSQVYHRLHASLRIKQPRLSAFPRANEKEFKIRPSDGGVGFYTIVSSCSISGSHNALTKLFYNKARGLPDLAAPSPAPSAPTVFSRQSNHTQPGTVRNHGDLALSHTGLRRAVSCHKSSSMFVGLILSH